MTTPTKEIQLEPANATEQAYTEDAARTAAAIAALDAGGEEGGAEAQDLAPEESGIPGAEPQPELEAKEGSPETPEPEGGQDEEPAGEPEKKTLESSRLLELARNERQSREKYAKKEEQLTAELASHKETLEQQTSRLKDLEVQIKSQADALFKDPIGALKSMGITGGYGDLAHVLMAAELGEDAPEEYMSKLQGRRMETALERQKREMDEKLEQIETKRQEAEFAEWQRGYVNKMDAFVKDVKAEEMPFVSVWYEHAPEEVLEMMYADASTVARETQTVLSPQDLAHKLNQKLESKLAPILDRLIDIELAKAEEADNQAEEAKKAAPTKTLRNAHNARTNPKTPAKTEEERMARALVALESSE